MTRPCCSWPCKPVCGPGAHLRCHGKGRKERCTPLRKDALRNWLEELRGEPDTPVFPNQRGGFLSHDGLGYLLAKHLAVARIACPSLKKKRVTPHVLRHTAAMDLLQRCVFIRTTVAKRPVEGSSALRSPSPVNYTIRIRLGLRCSP